MAGFKNGALALKKKDLGTNADPNFINILVDTDNKLYSIDEFGVYRFYVSESSLSGYLPLSGGTLTGGLSGTNAAFNGTLSYAGGTFRQYTGSPAWTSFYGSYATPNDKNYHLRFLGDGSSSLLNGTLESGLLVNDNFIARATSTGLNVSGVATANSFVKSGGTSTQFLKADGSVDSNIYITSSLLGGYLPLSGGTMTGSITIPTPNNILNPTSYSYIPNTSSPFAQGTTNYSSHDWSAYTAPTQETTVDGTTWVSATLSTKLFDAYPSPTSVQVINMATPLFGTRWTWNNVTYSYITKVLITYSYTGAIPTGLTQTVETSPNGTTWTNVGTSTGYDSVSPIIFSIPTVGANPWLRVTIKSTTGTGYVNANSVQLWTNRLGDQGKSKWNYLPFSWDYNKKLIANTVNADQAYIGKWVDNATYARMGHVSYNTSTGFGYLQTSDGRVFASSNTSVTVRIGAADLLTTTSAGNTLLGTTTIGSGTGILKTTSGVVSIAGLSDLPGGPYLPLSGGTMTGRIYSTKSGFSLTNAAISLESLQPTIAFRETDSVVNSRCWNIGTEYNSLTISSYDDTYSAGIRALQCYRAPSSGRISLFLGDMTTTDVFVPLSVGGILKADATTGKLGIASAGDFPIFTGGYLPLSGGTLTGLLKGTSVSASGNITATSFVKSGGTSTQFLKADGSVDANSYALGSSLGNYLPLAGGTLNIGAQIITRKDATTSPIFTNIKYSEAPLVIQRVSTSNSDTTNVAGIGFHNGGINAALFYYDPTNSNFYYNRHDGVFARIWDSTNLNNLNQLTNGPGYVTGGPYIPISGGVTATSAVIFGNAKIGRALVNGTSSRFGHEDHDEPLGYDGFYQENTGELYLATQGPQINFRIANVTRVIISDSLMTVDLPLSLGGNLSGTNASLTGKVTAQTARLGVQRVTAAGGYYLTSTGANSEYWVFVTNGAEFSNIYLPTNPQDGCAFCFVQQACRQVNIVSPTTGVLIHYYYSTATQSVSIPTTPATYLGANNTGPWVWVVYDSANGGGWWMTGSWSGTYA